MIINSDWYVLRNKSAVLYTRVSVSFWWAVVWGALGTLTEHEQIPCNYNRGLADISYTAVGLLLILAGCCQLPDSVLFVLGNDSSFWVLLISRLFARSMAGRDKCNWKPQPYCKSHCLLSQKYLAVCWLSVGGGGQKNDCHLKASRWRSVQPAGRDKCNLNRETAYAPGTACQHNTCNDSVNCCQSSFLGLLWWVITNQYFYHLL